MNQDSPHLPRLQPVALRTDEPAVDVADALAPSADAAPGDAVLETRGLEVAYDGQEVLRGLDMRLLDRRVTALIGPSGCGKTTLLRAFNRMNDLVNGVETRGEVLFRGSDLYDPAVDVAEVRRRIGMVFQAPNPFPKSVFHNVAWGPSIHGVGRTELPGLVEESLRQAALWDEVKDRLQDDANLLSGGQQQRLCIARALAMDPEVLLMDEPCSSLDPVSTGKIEELIFELRQQLGIVIVTHNMQQAARVSDFTAFLEDGQLVEFADTDQIFTRPGEQRTEDYVTGRFG